MISASNSNWLDRLRSSKGFPTGEEPDLDRFLSSSSSGSAPTPNDSTTHSESTQSQPPIPTLSRDPPPPPSSSNDFNGVLCDLFNMGQTSSRSFSLKSSRKQQNPRFFRVSSSDTELPSSSNDFRREKSVNKGMCNNQDIDKNNTNFSNNGGDEKEGDDQDIDLKAYTRSEVTIIDTSFEVWKSDKWVFRKNDEWKIKDKKGKSRISNGGGKKKRKVLVSKLGDGGKNKFNNDNDNDRLKMKKKKKRKREVENLLLHQQNKEQPQNDKEREPFKERQEFLSKVPQKRFPCPRPPEKVRNESSPVVVVRSIPPSNVNTALKPGKTFHKKRPKKMKLV